MRMQHLNSLCAEVKSERHILYFVIVYAWDCKIKLKIKNKNSFEITILFEFRIGWSRFDLILDSKGLQGLQDLQITKLNERKVKGWRGGG